MRLIEAVVSLRSFFLYLSKRISCASKSAFTSSKSMDSNRLSTTEMTEPWSFVDPSMVAVWCGGVEGGRRGTSDAVDGSTKLFVTMLKLKNFRECKKKRKLGNRIFCIDFLNWNDTEIKYL